MLRFIPKLLVILLLISCENKSTNDKKNSSNLEKKEDSVEETGKTKAENSKTGINNNGLKKEIIADTLRYYNSQKTSIPADLYKDIFNQELSDIDKAYLQEIRTPVNSVIPVIVSFKTTESDREKEYVNLHLFDWNWTLIKSLSVDYEMDWDLFRQEFQFVNDSIFKIYKYQGLSYENDKTVRTTLEIEINNHKILDTINTQIDTLN